jgi:hypothetical protein
VARKPLAGTVAANVLAHGTGALNIDGCRVGTDDTRQRCGATTLGRMNDDGWQPDAERIGGSACGRWPANLIHDGSDEVLAGFPAQSGASAPASAARFFYCAKASKRDRNEGLDDMPDTILARSCQAQAEAERGNVVEEAGGAFNKARITKNNHPTVKPTDLMRYLCRLVTPPGGLVLDPYTGSGSTAKAAALEGFRFTGFEIDPGYHAIAERRWLAAIGELA